MTTLLVKQRRGFSLSQSKGMVIMALASLHSQRDFYSEFLMSRESFNPRDFGIEMKMSEVVDRLVNDFGEFTRGQITLDELLFRPVQAQDFCNQVKRKNGWYDLPDDIILRSIMNRRKASRRKRRARGRREIEFAGAKWKSDF